MRATTSRFGGVIPGLTGITMPFVCALVLVATLILSGLARAGEDFPCHDPDAGPAGRCRFGAALSKHLQDSVACLELILPPSSGAYRELSELRYAHAALIRQVRSLSDAFFAWSGPRSPEVERWLAERVRHYDEVADRCTVLTDRLVRVALALTATDIDKHDTMTVRELETICDWLGYVTMDMKITAAGLEVIDSEFPPTTEDEAPASVGSLLDRAEKRMAAVAEQLRLRNSTRDSMSEMIRTCPAPRAVTAGG